MYILVCYFNKDNKDERSNNDLIEKKAISNRNLFLYYIIIYVQIIILLLLYTFIKINITQYNFIFKNIVSQQSISPKFGFFCLI